MIRVLIVDHTGERGARMQLPRGEQLKLKAERVPGVTVDFFFHANHVFGKAVPDRKEKAADLASRSGGSGKTSASQRYDLALLHMSNTSSSREEQKSYNRILSHACDHAIEFSGAGVDWKAEQESWAPPYDHIKTSARLLLSQIDAFLSVMASEASGTHTGFRQAVESVFFRRGSIDRLIEDLTAFDRLIQGMATALERAGDPEAVDSAKPEPAGLRGSTQSKGGHSAQTITQKPWLWFDDCRDDIIGLVAGKAPSSAFQDIIVGMDRNIAPAADAILAKYQGSGRRTDGALVRLVGCLIDVWARGETEGRGEAKLLLTDQRLLAEAHEEYTRLCVLASGAAGLIIEQFLEYRQYVNHTLWQNRLLLGLNSASSARRKLQDAGVWPLAKDEVESLLGVAGTLFGLDSLYLRETAEPRIRECLDAVSCQNSTELESAAPS